MEISSLCPSASMAGKEEAVLLSEKAFDIRMSFGGNNLHSFPKLMLNDSGINMPGGKCSRLCWHAKYSELVLSMLSCVDMM